jgi:hypothetical protein
MRDNSDLTFLDLCSGLGGASQPALDRGWRVIRVDIDPGFKPNIVADVRALPLRPFHVEVLWASSVCTDFAKWGMRCFYPNPPDPDLSLARAIKSTIDLFQPAAWIHENVWASRPFLTPIFGPVACLLPGHALWGRIPTLLPNIKPHKANFDRKHSKWWDTRDKSFFGTGHNGAGAAQVATIPYPIGEAICRAVEARRQSGGSGRVRGVPRT